MGGSGVGWFKVGDIIKKGLLRCYDWRVVILMLEEKVKLFVGLYDWERSVKGYRKVRRDV